MKNYKKIIWAGLFLILILVIINIILNTKDKIKTNEIQSEQQVEKKTIDESEKNTKQVYESKKLNSVKIIDNKIISFFSDGTSKIIIYPETNFKDLGENKLNTIGSSTESIDEVSLSPDKSKICFWQNFFGSMFYANSDGSEVTRIGMLKNCIWSNDSKKFIAQNPVSDMSPIDIYVFDLETKELKNYTNAPYRLGSESTTIGFLTHNDPAWISDNQSYPGTRFITAKYDQGMPGQEKSWISGNVTIDTKTGKVEYNPVLREFNNN